MRYKNVQKLGVFLTAFAICLLAHQTAAAQQSLQNTTTQSGLQPQASQSQNTLNTQDNVRGLQQNNPQDILSQKSSRTLSVVSDPSQTAAEAVVQPSTTLRTDPYTSKQTKSRLPILVWSLITVLAGFCVYASWRYYRNGEILTSLTQSSGAEDNVDRGFMESSAPVNNPSLNNPKKKKKTSKNKKRKKPHQR